jgi:hypothetical protein
MRQILRPVYRAEHTCLGSLGSLILQVVQPLDPTDGSHTASQHGVLVLCVSGVLYHLQGQDNIPRVSHSSQAVHLQNSTPRSGHPILGHPPPPFKGEYPESWLRIAACNKAKGGMLYIQGMLVVISVTLDLVPSLMSW